MKAAILILAALASVATAQQSVDNSAAAVVVPWTQRDSFPGVCRFGQKLTRTDQSVGSNEYTCGLSNNWVLGASGGSSISTYTIAAGPNRLPTTAATGADAIVSDGLNGGDSTVGGGTIVHWVRFNGTAWVSFGNDATTVNGNQPIYSALAGPCISITTSGTAATYNNLCTSGALTSMADGGSSPPIAGSFRCVPAPYSGTITSWKILGNVSGSIQFDVWAAAFGSTLPTSANSIVASAPPVLSSTQTATGSTSTWTTQTVTKDQSVCVSVTSASTLLWASLSLSITRSN